METVTIKNTTLTIHPRTAFDVLSAEELSKREVANEWPVSLFTFIVHTSLKRNLEGIPRYRFIKRYRIASLVSIQSLVRVLSLSEMNAIIMKINRVEADNGVVNG